MLDYWLDDDAYQEGVGVGSGEGAPNGQCAIGHEGSVPEPLLGEDEQNGWIEQTLNAAGLNDDDDDDVDGSHRHHQRTKDEQTTGGNNNSHGASNKKVSTQTHHCSFSTDANKCDQTAIKKKDETRCKHGEHRGTEMVHKKTRALTPCAFSSFWLFYEIMAHHR